MNYYLFYKYNFSFFLLRFTFSRSDNFAYLKKYFKSEKIKIKGFLYCVSTIRSFLETFE